MLRPMVRAIPGLLAIFVAAAVAAGTLSCARQHPTSPSGAAPTQPPGPNDPELAGQVVVTLAPGVNPADLAATHGAIVVEWKDDERVAMLMPGPGMDVITLRMQLAADPRVVTCEYNGWIETSETRQKSFAFDDGHNTPPDFEEQPAAAALRLGEAHAVSRGQGVRVAIIDTGIDPTHPVFTGRIAAAWDFLRDQSGAVDEADGVDDNDNGFVDESWGHGTHVAGIVALTAPEAELLVARVLDADGQGDVVGVAAGIRWAVANGARVINLSLGTLRSSDAIHDALDEAEKANVVIVASAGNWGAESPQEYPARSSDAWAVAASDVNAQPAAWTSFGSFVDLSAPGVAVRSAYPGGTYRLWSGTSMSAPFVSGAVALLLALHPTWSTDAVTRRLADTARPLTNVPSNQEGKLGDGMLDVGAALRPDAAMVAGGAGAVGTATARN